MTTIPNLDDFQAWVERFCESSLRSYLQSIKQGGFELRGSSREFNDPVWKTVSLTAFESIFVDCPLFQRLRRIRQLGVVHWVYPGAIHTRFEHSLGVVYQVQQLIDGINRSVGSSAAEPINREMTSTVRFAALCHDLGHGVLSHVSENALSGFDEVNELLLDFQKKHQNRRSRLSEITAYYMVGSKAFGELIDFALRTTRGPKPPANVAALTRQSIVGEIIAPATPLLQELISGPFDADKLDYMQRDAFMAGIPAVTDVPRLAAKVRSASVETQKLPERISQHLPAHLHHCTIFGVAFSGSRGLDELLLARVLLFDKIYRHHKVRALEGMVARLLEALQTIHTGALYALPYLFTDETLLEADQMLAARQEFAGSDEGVNRAEVVDIVGDLCTRLRDRTLFVRASVFGEHLTGMSPRMRQHMVRLLNQASSAHERQSLTNTLAAEIRRVLMLLHREEVLKGLADQSLYSYLWVDPPGNVDHAQKIVHAFLIRDGGGPVSYQDHSPEVAAWSRAYLSRKDVGFVFCIAELKVYTALAMEGLLAREYTLKLPRSASDHLKEDASALGTMREELRAAGYYQSTHFELRPEPERLAKADVAQVCSGLRTDMASYSPPNLSTEEPFAPLRSIKDDQRRAWLAQFGDAGLPALGLPILAKSDAIEREEWANIVRNSLNAMGEIIKSRPPAGPLADERVRGWLAQFEQPEFIEFALQVLRKVKLVGRDSYVKVVREFLAAYPDFKNSVIVALGDARDSGRIVAYLTQDVGLRALDFSVALQQERPILFVDDFVGSGSQVKGMLADWFGETQEGSSKLGERPRQQLDSDQIKRLQERPVAFVYAAGWNEGRRVLREACGQHGLRLTDVYLGETEETLPSLHDRDLARQEGHSAFCERCREVAREVLGHAHPGWGKTKLEERLLGYGNRGLLVVFPFNTPTQTLTCLWASGRYKEIYWNALFPRRSKD